MTTELKIYPRKARVVLGGVMMVAFVLLGLFFLAQGPDQGSVFPVFRNPATFYGIMGGGVLLFGWLAFYAANKVLRPRPAVTLGAGGVALDGFSGRFSAGWEAFSGYSLRNGRDIVLHLKDSSGFVAAQAPGRPQVSARTLTERFGSPFLIETGMLAIDPATVIAAVADRLPAQAV